MIPGRPPYRLFERFGVELEYMVVDADTLDACPIVDELLQAAAGRVVSEFEAGDVSWSNELTRHVVELKVTDPVASLDGVAASLHRHVERVQDVLRVRGARLMPGAAHPWMDPRRETQLWPHQYREIYRAFDRVFDCRRHGWANLQSVHLNLPFGDDREFGRLHAAVRLVLPILPALSAASPFLDGEANGTMDRRLEAYRGHTDRVPFLTGAVIPEPIFEQAAYERDILDRIRRELAPHDPEGIFEPEWANARGAIARFDRSTIEIRLIDMQECPAADTAVLWVVVHLLRALTEERWSDLGALQAWDVGPLADILSAAIVHADRALIRNPAYLRAFGVSDVDAMTAGELWRRIRIEVVPEHRDYTPPLDRILDRGPLARRILEATGPRPDRARLHAVYAQLCACLDEQRLFEP